MLVSIIISGLIYALPNLYGEDLAVQINGIHGTTVNEQTAIFVQKYLKEQHITIKSIALEENSILVRFDSNSKQLLARDLLLHALGRNFIIALNLVPATPHWLNVLNAKPIKLGLDLRGGIHFLIEVDTTAALDKLQRKNIDNLCNDLVNNNISFISILKERNYGIMITFHNNTIRNQAFNYIKNRYQDLVFFIKKNNQLYATISNASIKKFNEYTIQQNINILRNRVNQLGITEPLIQQQGINHILVELPGIQDATRAKEILSATATLEFHLINNNFNTLANINDIPASSEIKQTKEGYPVLLYKQVILTGDHITDSTSSQDEYNQPQVNISLDIKGGNIMSNFTKNNIGKLMATLYVEYKDSGKKDIHGHTIFIKEEKVINIANIQSRLNNNFRITGINNRNEARQLSLLLRSGALIAPIKIVEERIIGPTLGVENIKQGLKACLISLIISIIFMICFYKIFGVISTIALITNLILIVGIMSVLPGVTLTMPGIAGIVLTIAFAIDANVLINERIKEELHNGCHIQQAIEKGYNGAFSSIFDANITTIIKILILYTVSTDTIKGYAITTGIGLATSIFTAVIGTRAIINLICNYRYVKKLLILI